MNDTMKKIGKMIAIYLCWIVAHFVVSHMYARLCVPFTWYGLAMSPFLAPSPHCQAFRWIIYTGGNVLCNMWFLLGVWMCSYIIVV